MIAGKLYYILGLISFLEVVGICYSSTFNNIDVETKFGRITGLRTTYRSKTLYQFKQIPYAKPPTGNRRFAKPVPYGNWTGTLNATSFGPSCMHVLPTSSDDVETEVLASSMNEDCLHLNIYVPNSIDKENKKAVMVWIHGGDYITGHANSFDGSILAVSGDVLVITFNYRLNVFGFFSTGKQPYFGNMGLLDQRLALVWINQAIEEFGGDPNNVTIFGESAGAASVNVHITNPDNTGLFQRAILQSGNVLGPLDDGGYVTRKTSYGVAKLLNCSDTDNEKMMTCLNSITSLNLLKTYKRLMSNHTREDFLFEKIGFVPDNILIRKQLKQDLQDKHSNVTKFFKSIDLMVGTNVGANDLINLKLKKIEEKFRLNASSSIPARILRDILVPLLNEFAYEKCDETKQAIIKRYSDKYTSEGQQARIAAEFYHDVFSLSPLSFLLQQHAYKNVYNTYAYLFSDKTSMEPSYDQPRWPQSPKQGSEFPFLFEPGSWYTINATLSDYEVRLSERIVKYWTNFANTGNPNGQGLLAWKEFANSDRSYLELNITDRRRKGFFNDNVEFWNRDIPVLLNKSRNKYVVVNTAQGKLRGMWNQENTVIQFKQIPYAKPPINQLRFRKPQPVEMWTGITDALHYGPSCVQNMNANDAPLLPNTNISEDCLHLNIFVPKSINPLKRRSVMIWIHGGGFTSGQSTMYDASKLSTYGDVILVTINYRLNIFGFFSTGGTSFRGNYGLYDQQLAIRWVKDNIEHFGGDPKLITLFGNSAGGVSTTLQAIIPSNKGLFHRVIGESGSCLSRRDVNSKTHKTSQLVITKLNCRLRNESETVNCLQSVSAKKLLDTYNEAAGGSTDVYTLTTAIGPITDGELIPQEPQKALEDSDSQMYSMFRSVDLLVGTNTADAGLLYFNLLKYQKHFKFNVSVGIPSRIICDYMTKGIMKEILNNCNKTREAICKKYTPETKNPPLDVQTQMAADLYSELLEDAPTIKSLDIHSFGMTAGKRSYQYLLSYKPTWELISDRPRWLKGVNHASEVPLLFGLDSFYPSNIPVSKEDREVSNRMMLYWTNFAKYGDPIGRSSNLTWPQYDPQQQSYLILDLNDTISSSLYPERMTFWITEIPQIMSSCNNRQQSNIASSTLNLHFVTQGLFIYAIWLFLK